MHEHHIHAAVEAHKKHMAEVVKELRSHPLRSHPHHKEIDAVAGKIEQHVDTLHKAVHGEE